MKPKIIHQVHEIFKAGFENKSLIKAKLSGPEDTVEHKHITISLAELKAGLHCKFVYTYDTKDITKNYDLNNTLDELSKWLILHRNISIITTDKIYQYDPKKDKFHTTDSESSKASLDHNKTKHKIVAESRPFLRKLGITNQKGLVIKDKKSKLTQINKYIEIIDPILEAANLSETCNILDMGCGKGYLTFALYDHLTQQNKYKPNIKGIEVRPDLVSNGNGLAEELSYQGLSFKEGYISDYPIEATDILIALHACDTATDDAIKYGIAADAKLIICSPCCHKQVRKAMGNNNPSQSIIKHGILKERQAEIITDTIRALIMEYHGYKTRIMEFVSTEHTPKNLLIIGTKRKDPDQDPEIIKRIKALKEQYGISEHYLENILP